MQIVPLAAAPNQTATVSLGNQVTQLNVYQKQEGLFMDVLVNDIVIVQGVVCQNLNRVVRSLYLGFIGDLAWIDNQGDTDPYYTGVGGVGSRYNLAYIEASEFLPNEG